MVVYWLAILLTMEPGPTIGILKEYKTLAECEAAKATLAEDAQPRLKCLALISKPLKEA